MKTIGMVTVLLSVFVLGCNQPAEETAPEEVQSKLSSIELGTDWVAGEVMPEEPPRWPQYCSDGQPPRCVQCGSDKDCYWFCRGGEVCLVAAQVGTGTHLLCTTKYPCSP